VEQNQRTHNIKIVLLVLLVALSFSYGQPGSFKNSTRPAVSEQPIGSPFKQFQIPTNQSGPEAIIQDANNSQRFWFTEYSAGKIGELWQNGTIQDFHIPESGAAPTGLAMDSHGNIWFADQAGAGSIWEFIPSLAPSAQAFKQYFTKTSNSFPYAVVVDHSDNVWFTEGTGDRVGKFPYGGDNSNNMTEYPTPTSGSGPTGMAAQAGTPFLWIAETYASKIARFDTSTGTFVEFAEPMTLPLGIAVDGNGNVWVSEHGGSTVDELVSSNSTFRKFPTSPASVASGYSMTGPATVSIDQSGRVWFLEHYANRVGLLTPSTGTIAEFAIPYDSYSLLDTVDSKGDFWFTEFAANQIGMLNGTASVPFEIQTETSGPTVTAGNSLNVQFSISNIGLDNATISLTSASSFKPVYQVRASEVSLNASLLTLRPGEQVSVEGVITPEFSLSSGVYAAGLVAIYGNSSIVKDVFLNVNANILYRLEAAIPYVLIVVTIALLLTFIVLRRRSRSRHGSIEQAEPTTTLPPALALFILLMVSAIGTANAKCPGLPPPPGGYSGPDPYGIALDVGSIVFFAVVAYLLIRSRLRGQGWAQGNDQNQQPESGSDE
jgi:virginiamycin B lyase